MAVLNVNIDHIATIRQARQTDEPDPVWAAVQCELAGANGITVHLRQDRRHIKDRDVHLLSQTVACKLNLEMSIAEEIVNIADQIKPDQVTLVPENRQELTTEGGLDCVKNADRISQITKKLHKNNTLVSAFVEPIPEQIIASAKTNCDAVELHTGMYANASHLSQTEKEIDRLAIARNCAMENHLTVHAGHGLTYRNIGPVAQIKNICEFNIGHSIIARASLTGIKSATLEMIHLIEKYSCNS